MGDFSDDKITPSIVILVHHDRTGTSTCIKGKKSFLTLRILITLLKLNMGNMYHMVTMLDNQT